MKNSKIKVEIDFDGVNYSKKADILYILYFGKFFTELVKTQDKQSRKRVLRVCKTY